MKSETEELLYYLLWTAEALMHPTFRNLTESFEGWAYRNGHLHTLAWLEHKAYLERQAGPTVQRIYRLTQKGRLHVLGGRDPAQWWSRRWDGRWRLVVFDVPESQPGARLRLRRLLRAHWFGCLQKSLWITPCPVDELVKNLNPSGGDVKSLVTFEATSAGADSDNAITSGAWNFAEINRRYEKCLAGFREFPADKLNNEPSALRLQQWAQRERVHWLDAVAIDPLLPSALLPTHYLGKLVWQKRTDLLARAGSLISKDTFF